MKHYTLLLWITCVTIACSQQQKQGVYPDCEDCELVFEGMPTSLSWQTTIAKNDEPGERLIIEGIIYKPDGHTPAEGVVLYVYHTDNRGKYTPAHGQKDGKRHGHLRGWVKTDASGRYQFSTIRPASYPLSREPQHIHAIVMETSSKVYWIDNYHFTDDPYVDLTMKDRLENRGGNGLITLQKGANDMWLGQRDIILGLNIK